MTSLAIIEKYDRVVNYLYPIIQNMPRRHGGFRDRLLDVLFTLPGQIYSAAKSNQISRLYAVDAALAELRWLLRFAANEARKLMTPKQHEVVAVNIAEVGSMVGAWIKARR